MQQHHFIERAMPSAGSISPDPRMFARVVCPQACRALPFAPDPPADLSVCAISGSGFFRSAPIIVMAAILITYQSSAGRSSTCMCGHRCRGHRCRVLSSRASCPLRLVLCIDFVLHVRIDFESAKRAGRRSASVGGARVWGRRPSVHVHGACVRSVTGSCLDPMPKPQWTRCTLWPELRACCYVLGARGCVHARQCAREDVRARMHARTSICCYMCWELGRRTCWAV